MASSRLQQLRAERAAQTSIQGSGPKQLASMDATVLATQLEAARETSNAADKEVTRQRAIVAKIERQLSENLDAIEKANRDFAAAALAGKPLPTIPADTSEQLSAAGKLAHEKLNELKNAAERAGEVLRRVEAAVEARASADRKATAEAELQRVVGEINQAIAPHLTAIQQVLAQHSIHVPVGKNTIGGLVFERVAPTAPTNVFVPITDASEIMRRKRAGLDLEDAKRKLTYMPGSEGHTKVMLEIEITRESAPETPEVLTPEQIEARDAETLAGASVRRAARVNASDEQRAEDELKEKQRDRRFWKKYEIGTGNRVGTAAG